MQATDVMDREIERRLESYARARLSPDPQAVARARARVMREARLQFEASRIAIHMAPTISIAVHRSRTRRLAMPLLAASVWLGIAVGANAAAQAGGPLYPTRMWVENAVLPSTGASRATAELERLNARLAEAMSAAARGDAGAVQAALDAYREIADEAIAAAAGDADLEALVTAALDRHEAVLTAVAAGLVSQGNDTAAAAVEASIQRAIDHNQAVIKRIGENGAGGAENGSTGGSGTGGTGGSGGTGGTGTVVGPAPSADNGGGNGGTGGTGGTGTTDGKPAKTPKPAPSADPLQPPDHSPRGQEH